MADTAVDLDRLLAPYVVTRDQLVPKQRTKPAESPVARGAWFGPWASHAGRCGCTWCR